MKRIFLLATLAVSAIQAGAAELDSDPVYTLYRSSSAHGMQDARIHVATFDAAEGLEYNRGNCLIAADLFKQQPGVIVRYWCEAGRFRSSVR